MYCALCKKEITKGFTNPESHEPNCPIYANTEKVADIIVEATLETTVKKRIEALKATHLKGGEG